MGKGEESDKHKKPSYMKDYKLILDVLREMQLFKEIPKRKHTFTSLQGNLLQTFNGENIQDCIVESIVPFFI